MEVTVLTWIISVAGLLIMGLLSALQLVAVISPREQWTIKNVYCGAPDNTDPKAYFAFNQGFAWADAVFWGPLQVAGSIGMMMGHRWGFVLALAASVPFWYTSIQFFIWDRDLRIRENTLMYWVVIWGMWPAFGILEGVYCFVRLVE